MGALVATLNNGQLNGAVVQSQQLLERLKKAGTEAGQSIDKIGATNGPRQAGAGVADTQRKLTGLGSAAARTTGALRTGFAGAVGGIRSFRSSITGATTSFLNLRGVALSLTAGFSFGQVVSELRGFEATMAQVQGVTRATGDEFGQLQTLAQDLGRNTQFSAQEAAEGVLFLARAGQDTNTIMQTLPPTLKFAQAGAIALGDAANFATNIMGGFQLGAEQTEQSLNALVTVANNANTDITSLASAMSFVAPAAQAAGVSLETTAAAIGVLGDVGIDASKAGTSLRQILIRLSNTDPPNEVVEGLASLGLTIDDVNPKTVGLGNAFQTLRDKELDLTAATKIVGAEAASAFLALANGGEKVVTLGLQAETTTDSLDVMSAAMANTLDGAVKRASSAFSGLIQAIGARGTTSFLTEAFDSIASVINTLTDNLDAVLAPIIFVIGAFTDLASSAANLATALAATFGPQVVGLFDQMTASVANLTGGVSILLPAVQGIISAFTILLALRVAAFFISLVNPIGLAVAAIGALGGILLSLSGTTLPGVIRRIASGVDTIIGLFKGLGNAAALAFSILGEVISRPFVKLFDFLADVVDGFFEGFRSAFEFGIKVVGSFVNLVGGELQALKDVVSESVSADALIPPNVRADFSNAAEEISEAFNEGVDFSGATDAVKPLVESLEEIGPATDTSAQQAVSSIQTAQTSIEDLGTTAEITGTTIENSLTGAQASLDDVGDTAEASGTKVQASFADAGDAADAFDVRVKNIAGTFDQFFDALGVDISNFAANAETLANRLGTSLEGSFTGFAQATERALGLAEGQFGAFAGAAGVIISELGISGEDVFKTLGISAESDFAKVAGTAIKVFGTLSNEQFSALLSAATTAFSGIISAVGGAIASYLGLGTAGTAANTAIATSGATATAATASTGVAAAGTSGAFATLGTTATAALTGIGSALTAIGTGIATFITSTATLIASVLEILATAIATALVIVAEGIAAAILVILNSIAIGLTVVGEAALASAAGLAIAAVFLAIVAVAAIAVAVAIVLITDALIRFTEFLFETAARLDDFVNDVADAIDLLIRRIGQSFELLIETIIDSLTGLGGIVPAIIQAVIDSILDIFESLLTGVVDIVAALVEAIVDLFRVLGEGIAQIIGDAIAIIVDIFESLSGLVSGAIRGVIDIFEALGEVILAVFEGAGDVISAFVDIVLTLINGLVDAVVALFTGLGEAVGAIFTGIGEAIEALAGAFVAIFTAVIDAVGGLFRALGDAVAGIFNAIGAAGQALGDALTSVFQALGAAIEAIFSAVNAAADVSFNNILSAGAEIVSSIIGFFTDLLVSVTRVFGEILATGVRVLRELVGLLREIVALLREIIQLAGEAGDAVGGIGSPGGGGGFNPLDPIGIFAKGGLINQPVRLASAGGLTQSSFRTGGVLDSLTTISNGASVTPTSQIGLAGEAGPEFIVPAVRTSDGDLGIKAIAPPGQAAGGGTTVVNTFNIDARGAGDEAIKELRAMVREVDRSIPIVSAQVTARMTKNMVRTS